MAGLGEDYYLNKDQLKSAFEAAQQAGDDKLVHYHETALDFYATFVHSIDCYSLHSEKTVSYKQQSEDMLDSDDAKTLARHIASYDTERIIAVYDLSKPFEEAVGGADMIEPEIFDMAAEFRAQDQKQEPWYKKFFGFRP